MKIAGAGILAMVQLSRAKEMKLPGRTNILFIVCDDLNDSVVGMGGHPQAKTPNIDRLMARGVKFTNNQCNAPLWTVTGSDRYGVRL